LNPIRFLSAQLSSLARPAAGCQNGKKPHQEERVSKGSCSMFHSSHFTHHGAE